ncbi:hypothetical protein LguiB_023408 [Lonicera macranthoides]
MGGVDTRQLMAGVLTVTMFVMLANMIKKDHLDPLQVELAVLPTVHYDASKASEQSVVTLTQVSDWPWKEDGLGLKPCWAKPALVDADQSKGFVTFSLINGPEYHVSQIADALVVARYLRATLVLPDVRGSKPGDKRKFQDIYNVEKFVKSLNGVVKVVKQQPADLSARNLAVLRIPNRVSEEHIAEKVEPVFRTNRNIRLATYFPSVNMRKSEQKSNVDSVACLGMFGTLKLQPEVQEVVESMVERLRTLSRKSDGQFIAVDLRVDILKKRRCKENGVSGSKSCYSPQEVADFLRKTGFGKDTAIYLTQSRWDSRLDALRGLFPNTYTKESIMPVDKKGKFLNSDASEFEKVFDFYICSTSDVFVPAISGLFYANVAGKRIASGKTQILVPSNIPDMSAPAEHFITPYVTKKNHLAYSCFC